MAKKSGLLIAGLVGATALTIGAVVYAKTRDSETPSSSTPVTDAATTHYLQRIVAQALEKGPHRLLPGLTSADYNSSDVDSNPENPRWKRVVSTFQTLANKILPSLIASEIVADQIPADFPSQLRTDGVVDWATATLLKGPALTPSDIWLVEVTDPPRIQALQTYVANETDANDYVRIGLQPSDQFLKSDIDGNSRNPKWMRIVSAFQKWVNGQIGTPGVTVPAGFPIPLRTDGVTDLATSWAIENA